jgi:hypothetical protein
MSAAPSITIGGQCYKGLVPGMLFSIAFSLSCTLHAAFQRRHRVFELALLEVRECRLRSCPSL